MVNSVDNIPPITLIDAGNTKTGDQAQKLQTNTNKTVTANSVVSAAASKSEIQSNSTNMQVNKQNKVDYNELAGKIKALFGGNDLEVHFSYDNSSRSMIMKLVNSKTNEVVNQYPPEVTLEIAKIVSSIVDQGHVTNAKV